MKIRLPNNWKPRPTQRKLLRYLARGGTRAAAVWHRRAGKDDVALHWTAIAAHKRIGTYWHMLPEAAQARKAIWEAVNPRTGLRRIDEAFPKEIRANTRDHEMFIRFTCGSTWQVVGSDNFNSLVGAPPIGVVFSEWAIANPQSWAYLRPILAENGGWAIFIYTPRGHNHGETTFQSATRNSEWFAELLTADQTLVFTKEQLERERRELIDEYGKELGDAYYRQEYQCSFSAAVLGSVYGLWLETAAAEGRITKVPYDPETDVHVSFDLGYGDATSMWFFQVYPREVRFIDYYESSGHDVEHYATLLNERGYRYHQFIYLPHDAKNALMAAGGRSIQRQFWDLGYPSMIVPAASDETKIQAGRATMKMAWFDDEKTAEGRATLGSYHYDWDPDRKKLSDHPHDDWSCHGADAFGYGAMMWMRLTRPIDDKPAKPKYGTFAWMLKNMDEPNDGRSKYRPTSNI